jgi:superfamily II DNA or RNA helicase
MIDGACITKGGYRLTRDALTMKQLQKIKLDLVAEPITNEKYYTPNNRFNVYRETIEIDRASLKDVKYIYVPKMYGIREFGEADTTPEYSGEIVEEIKFVGDLKEVQIEPYNQIIKAVKDARVGGGIVCLETGYGKSIIAIKVILETRKKALVIVNKISLLEQWIAEFKRFAPEARVGRIQGKTIDIESKDVVIGMLQSMVICNYPDVIYNTFGIVVMDEAHNIPSKNFSRVLFKVSCPIMIGLSATPERADGLDKVLKWHIGDDILKKNNTSKQSRRPEIRILRLKSSDYKEIKVYNKMRNEEILQFSSMLTHLVEIKSRNKLIIDVLKDVMINKNRKVLLLTERRGHAEMLKSMCDSIKDIGFTSGLFLGGLKIEKLNEARSKDVIIATIAAFSEGVSEKDLNTLILVSPKKFVGHIPLEKRNGKKDSGKMEQIVGRIFRKEHSKETPALIIDFADQFSVFKSHSEQRRQFYKNHFKETSINYKTINMDSPSVDNFSCTTTTTTTTKVNELVDTVLLPDF